MNRKQKIREILKQLHYVEIIDNTRIAVIGDDENVRDAEEDLRKRGLKRVSDIEYAIHIYPSGREYWMARFDVDLID